MSSMKHLLLTRRGLALAVVILAFATTGCGATEKTKTATGADAASSQPSNQGAESRQAPQGAATSDGHLGEGGKPQKVKSETEKAEDAGNVDDAAYRESKELCSLFPVGQIAAEYGGNPADLTSVAHAYAETSYRPEFQASAEVGCLEGLR